VKLRDLPSVDELARSVVDPLAVDAARRVLERAREEIRAGADDGAEMGAFHLLFEPQREKNLRLRLDEYLRFGLEAGIFYAS
jgi:hypothetical protein